MAKQKSKSGENIKGDILSFRVPKEVREKVAIQLESKPVLKCESPHKFARKLMLDWVAGRLQYKNAAHYDADSDILDDMANLPVS